MFHDLRHRFHVQSNLFRGIDTRSKNDLVHPNRLSSTIDGNVEFVHSQYICILTPQVSTQFLCPTKSSKIINNNDNFRIKCYFYSKISAILVSVLTLFY